MRKFSKTVLTAGGVCFAAGISLCIAGWILGYEPGSLQEQYRERRIVMADENEVYEDQQEFADISALKVSMGAAECRITSWEGDEIKVTAKDSTLLECRRDGEKLKISYGANNTFWNWMKMQEAGFIRIYVPEGLELKLLDVEGGASSISMENLSCRELDMEVGAGSFSFEGEVKRAVSVSCGVGSVSLMLNGKADDFDYKMGCGLGSISVENGPNIAGIGENKTENRGTKKMELECGLGSISVAFRKE